MQHVNWKVFKTGSSQHSVTSTGSSELRGRSGYSKYSAVNSVSKKNFQYVSTIRYWSRGQITWEVWGKGECLWGQRMNHPDDRAPVAGDEVCANKGTNTVPLPWRRLIAVLERSAATSALSKRKLMDATPRPLDGSRGGGRSSPVWQLPCLSRQAVSLLWRKSTRAPERQECEGSRARERVKLGRGGGAIPAVSAPARWWNPLRD